MALVSVTGASGFVGRHLVRRLLAEHDVRCLVRSAALALPEWRGAAEVVGIGDIGPGTDWRPAVKGAEVVVHLAAIAHRRGLPNARELDQVNVHAVRDLANAAASCGVRRLVLVSSIGVHGLVTGKRPFDESSPLRPHDAYSASKLEAERVVRRVTAETDLEYVIVRPPLVYGYDAPGNFPRLVSLVSRGVPLPFGKVANRRSLVSIENLADFLACVTVEPSAADEEFVISDGEDLSTPSLIRHLSEASGVPTRLIDVPDWLLRTGLAAMGRSQDYLRLCGSLQVNSQKARDLLVWRPPFTLAEGIKKAVEGIKRGGGTE